MQKTINVASYLEIMRIMGKLNVKVKDDVDTKFREEVFKRKGMKKGNITEALEEAMLLWISTEDTQKNAKNTRKIKEPQI